MRNLFKFETSKTSRGQHFFGLLLPLVVLILSQIHDISAAKLRACNPKSTTGSKNNACVCNDGDRPDVRCVNVPNMREIPTDFLPKVRSLVIRDANIGELLSDDFAGYDDIVSLNLDYLQLYTIDERAFRNLYKLEILSLQGNALTRLDLSGKTFRFLTSLQSLDASLNKITTINRYSFRSILPVTKGVTLTVNLRQNDINCGCDVYYLRKWMLTTAGDRLELKDFVCANKNYEAFDRVPISEYNYCDDLRPEPVTCKLCTDVSTNYECNLQKTTEDCPTGKRCQRTVTYRNNAGIKISSQCADEDPCALRAFNNRDTCLREESISNRFQCDYCCIDAICSNTSSTDRTNDFEYRVNYYTRQGDITSNLFRVGSISFLQNAVNQKKSLEREMKKFEGGWYFQVQRFEPMNSDTSKVVATIAVTVLNWRQEVDLYRDLETRIKSFINSDFNNPAEKSFARIVNAKCKVEPFRFNFETKQWPEAYPGDVARLLCTDPNNFDASQYAQRKCIEAIVNQATWGDVDTSRCFDPNAVKTSSATKPPTKPPTKATPKPPTKATPKPTPKPTTPKSTVTTKTPVTLPPDRRTYTPEEAQKSSNEILTFLEDSDSLTSDDVIQVVALLEDLSNKDNLAFENVSASVLLCVDGVIEASDDTLRTSEEEKKTSTRLLRLIDSVATNAPLKGGKFQFSSPNLVVAARSVSIIETRNLVFSEVESSDDKMGIKVGFSQRSPQPNAGYSNLVIPTQSVISQLTFQERKAFQRMTFSLHNNSKLFESLKTPKRQNYIKLNDDNDADENDDDDNDIYYLENQVNGRVISASVPGVKVKNLPENITMTFEHTEKNSTNPECVYWDASLQGGLGDWSSEGCGVVRSDDTTTTCGCTHLTNFALLMDVYQESGGLSQADRTALSIISFVGCGISLFTLILTLITYSLFRKLRRDTPSKILINLCVALVMANLIFLVGMQDYTFDSTLACKIIGVLLHYFMMASMTWMAVEAFYMYLALVLVFKTYFSNFLLKISLFGWGVPLIAIAITLGVNATDNYGLLGNGLCWIKTPAFYFAFVAPVCLILLINFIAFGLVIRQLMQMSSAKLNTSDRYGTMQRLRGAIGVIILLGLTWVFAVFAIDSASVVFYYLFAIFNSLQGLFIFIFYCVFKADAATSWKRFLSCCFDQTDLGSTSTSRATTTNPHDAHRKSSNSSGNNTLSTASTIAKGSTSSNIYDSIDSSYNGPVTYSYMNMSQQSNGTTLSSSLNTSPNGLNTMVTKFTSDIDSNRVDHGLNHVYSNQPSRYQFSKGAESPARQFSQEQPYVSNSPTNLNEDRPAYAKVNTTSIKISRTPSQGTPPSSPSRNFPRSSSGEDYNASTESGMITSDGSNSAQVKDIILRFETSTSSDENNRI